MTTQVERPALNENPPSPVDGSGRMFDRIARRYDMLNRVLSMGIDRSWRRKAVRATCLEGRVDASVLDLATGTADLALQLAQAYPGAKVLGIDPSTAMLEIGRGKARSRAHVELRTGDAQRLALADGIFDAVTIAFGIRNVPDRPAALREMARVTKKGGRVVVLELSEPPAGILAWPARVWVHKVVPRIGSWLSGEPEYRYLQRSIAAFPPAEEFAELMRDAGLQVLSIEPLTFGVATLFVATPAEVAGDSDAGVAEGEP